MVLLKILPILTITLVYGIIYGSIHRADPGAFGFNDGLVDPFYFSFTTMSSVGYGDYRPNSRIAKMLVMSQQFLLIGEVVSILGLDNINKLA